MGLRTSATRCIALILCMLITACVANPTITLIATLPITLTPPPHTISPTVTRTTSITPTTLPPTQPPTSMPAPIPTLTNDQATKLVEDMLLTNGGCDLPCWWGGKIIPGKTKFDNAVSIFESQGIPLFLDNVTGSGVVGFDVPPTKLPFTYKIGVEIERDNDLVKAIRLDSEVYAALSYRDSPSARFTQAWQLHSWSNILYKYGIPTDIRVSIYHSNYAEPAGAWLVLIYDKLGMAIAYWETAQDVDSKHVRVCPNFQKVTEIILVLVPVEKFGGLYKLMQPPNDLSNWRTLEKATNMNIQTFLENFKNGRRATCLQTSSD